MELLLTVNQRRMSYEDISITISFVAGHVLIFRQQKLSATNRDVETRDNNSSIPAIIPSFLSILDLGTIDQS